jgi:diguanylate cyclase (GGDEF)-like protein
MSWDTWRHRLGYEALAGQRDLVIMRLTGVGAMLLAFFVVQHGLGGRTGPALVNLLLVLVLGATALSLHWRQRPALPYLVISALFAAGIGASTLMQGTPGLFGAYPAVMVNFFMLSVGRAMLMGSLTLGVTTVCALSGPAADYTLRFAASLGFVLVMVSAVALALADLERALRRQATTDPLTGALNRRRLDEELAAGFQPAQAHSTDALLVIDVDHFKRINDAHGHAAGDRVLRELATLLSQHTRAGDLLFRLGGEEFLLLLRRVNAEEALGVAETLRAAVETAAWLPAQPVTVSMGVALREPGEPGGAWLRRGDVALFAAKREGRNRVVAARGAP